MRFTCDWLQRGRNSPVPSRGWGEPGSVWLISVLPTPPPCPSLLNIKEARILTQASWLPEGVAVCYILGLLAFSIKSLLLAHQLASRLSGLLCGEEYKIRLGNKFWWNLPGAFGLTASRPWLGNIRERHWQLPGPLGQGASLQSSGCLSTGQLKQRINIKELKCCPHR